MILEGPKTAPSSALRVRGFNEALKEFPGVKVLATANGNYARKSAAEVMTGLVRKHTQIDGVLAANDPMAQGALDALGPAGRKALVVGINAGRDAVDLIKSGACSRAATTTASARAASPPRSRSAPRASRRCRRK